MTTKVYRKWEDVNETWDDLNQVWEEVVIILQVSEIIKRGGGLQAYIDGNPWDVTKRKLGEEKTKRFVEIVCKVNDLDYERVYESKELKVSVDHIQRTFRETLKIEIKI